MTQPAQQPANVTPLVQPIPDFEKAPVSAAAIKISGTVSVDTYQDTIVSLDDRVRLVGEYRVVGVNFKVDEKTGETKREQILRPINLQLCPWDPADPNDQGIVKARP